MNEFRDLRHIAHGHFTAYEFQLFVRGSAAFIRLPAFQPNLNFMRLMWSELKEKRSPTTFQPVLQVVRLIISISRWLRHAIRKWIDCHTTTTTKKTIIFLLLFIVTQDKEEIKQKQQYLTIQHNCTNILHFLCFTRFTRHFCHIITAIELPLWCCICIWQWL